jgi:hypothetical protein
VTGEQAEAILDAIDALAADVAAMHAELGRPPTHSCYPLAELPTVTELVSVK